MSAREPDPLALARKAVAASAVAADADPPDPLNVYQFALTAQVHATIAVAEQLERLTDAVEGVASSLKDQDNHGAGTHLHYISDWLQDIARKT